MLVGVTQVGALRQRVEKAVAYVGGSSPRGKRATAEARPLGTDGLVAMCPPLGWLGSVDARDEWAGALAGVLDGALPPNARGTHGGREFVTPPAVDRHVIEVASAAEQAALGNLLRQFVPVLIALTGRESQPGARRLVGGGGLVATRYLESADPHYQAVLSEHLRRGSGVAALDRMDVYPAAEADGTLTVVVQCVDAAPTLAAVRAHAVLLSAFALRARRMLRDGEQADRLPQREVDEHRARAMARGLRARAGWGNRTAHPLREHAYALLSGPLSKELDNLEATAEELFPVLAPMELPGCGLGGLACEDAALGGADPGRVRFWDAQPGGPYLRAVRGAAPGRARWVLAMWNGFIAARGASAAPVIHRPSPGGPRAGKGTDGHR